MEEGNQMKNAEKIRKLGVFLTICVSVAVMVGCGKGQESEETEKLTVCTEEIYQPEVETIAKIWQKMNGGSEVEVVAIPQDASLAEAQVTKLRTEIMSGGGPDIFIMASSGEAMDEEPAVLFSNPEKLMRSDLFLPLDDYIADAQYINPGEWNQKIMDAGKTEEGQMVLPIAYTYYAYSFRTTDLQNPSFIPNSWEELKAWKEPEIVTNLTEQTVLWFSQTFGELADYENETLLFSEEELMNRVEEAFAWENENRMTENQEKILPVAGGMGENSKEFWQQVVRASGENETIIAIPNDENGLTAYITLYAAVNRNTEYPDQAFSLLDFMFSDAMMSGKGVQIDNSEIYYGINNNFPTAAMLTNKTAVQQVLRNQTVKSWNEEVENRINSIRFYSDLDDELCRMYMECISDEYGPSPSTEKKREIASQAYEKMRMKLAE